MIALQLPFADPDLPRKLRAVNLRFWPDQIRLLDTEPPIEEQIRELKSARLLGNLAYVYLRPTEEEGEALWIIETHAGSSEERSDWIRSEIEMAGHAQR